MKGISFSIFLVVAFVLLYYDQPAIALQQEKGAAELANLPPSTEEEWPEQESEEIAKQFLRNSPTFVSRGIEDSLKLVNTTLLEQPFSWQFDYKFECWCPGYGWLSIGPTPQAVTLHLARIIVRQGEVIFSHKVKFQDIARLSLSPEENSDSVKKEKSPKFARLRQLTRHVQDDFRSGWADKWDVEEGWSFISENGNYVFQGIGHKWARAGSKNWGDYTFHTWSPG